MNVYMIIILIVKLEVNEIIKIFSNLGFFKIGRDNRINPTDNKNEIMKKLLA